MVLLLLLVIMISPILAVIPASRRLLVGRRKVMDALPMAFILSLFGLFYVPSLQVDLTRYFGQLNSLRLYGSFEDLFRTLDTTNKLQISQQIFFYVMSRFSLNSLMPFAVVLIVALIGFYIIKDFSATNEYSMQIQAFMYVAFLMLMPWGVVITNIRWITGIALFMLATYRDLYQQRHNWLTLLIYLAGCTMHIAVIGFLGVRVGIYVLRLFLNQQIKTQTKLVIIVAIVILAFIFMQTSLFNIFWQKAMTYLSGGGQGSGIQTWFEMADNSIGRRLGKYAEELFTLTQSFFIIPAIKKTFQQGDLVKSQTYLFALSMLLITFILTLMPGTTWVRFAFMVTFCVGFIISAEETYLKNQYFVLVNQSVWVGMLLWSIIWQVYQYVGSEVMTRADFFNIFFPVWRLFQ